MNVEPSSLAPLSPEDFSKLKNVFRTYFPKTPISSPAQEIDFSNYDFASKLNFNKFFPSKSKFQRFALQKENFIFRRIL